MFLPISQEPDMTAVEARSQLTRLEAERIEAIAAGLGDNDLYMDALRDDIAASHAAYVGLAVTEIASLRGQLGGRLVG